MYFVLIDAVAKKLVSRIAVGRARPIVLHCQKGSVPSVRHGLGASSELKKS
jgi:hypothetical protein